MGYANHPPLPLPATVEGLFDFAIGREDVKWLVANLPTACTADRITVDYELQILKIIFVGWAISFCLGNHPRRQELAEEYWKAVYEFSRNLSHTTGLVVGKDINYFQTLQHRLDTYLAAIQQTSDTEPAAVVGRQFAKACGNEEDIFTALAGSKLFVSAISRVQQYLSSVEPDGSAHTH